MLFIIDNGVEQGSIMPPQLYNVFMDGVKKKMKMEMGRIGVRFSDEERMEIA